MNTILPSQYSTLRPSSLNLRRFAGVSRIDKRAAARRSAALTRTIRDALFSETLDGLIDSWSLSAERVFGYSAGEVLGRSAELLVPVEARAEYQRVTRLIKGGSRLETYKSVRRTKTGALIDVALTVTPVIDAEGRTTGLVTIIQSHSNNGHTTVDSNSDDDYRTIFEQSPVAMWIYDAITSELLAANGAAAKLVPPGNENIVRSNAFLMPADVIGARARGFSSRAIRFSGRDARLVVASVPSNQNIADEEIRRLKVEIDERARERTSRLLAIIDELEMFSCAVSHDLRAPVRAIEGFSTILAQDHCAGVSAEGLELLDRIRRQTGQMGKLIDDLLAFGKASRQELKTGEIDMTALAQSAAANLTERSLNGIAAIKIHPLPPARGDASMLRQVFANLLENAVKFSRRQSAPLIEVTCKLKDGQAVYCVRDNGVGFDARRAERLFGAFQRLHRQADFEGNGIGLALVHRIIARHGGKVWAESELGRGATFHFTLC